MALDGDFIHDLNDTYSAFAVAMLEKMIERGIMFDAVWCFSDMAYKNGPFMSPAFFDEFYVPYYRRFREFCDRHGKFMILHSDGNMTKLLPGLIRAGFEALNPLEARSGMDVGNLKEEYGAALTFYGNINADIIAGGTDAEVEEEVRAKSEAAKPGGGYIFAIDHSTPPTVSLQRNMFMFECARKYADY